MTENKKVIWALFDSGTGSYKQAVKKYFDDEADIYSVGIDIENKSTDFLNLNLGDISEYFGESLLFQELDKLPKPDIILASPPCFTGETRVNTPRGYKRIDKIKVGDEVYTFNGKIKKVLKVGGKVSFKNVILSINGIEKEISTTTNHPFLVANKRNISNQYKKEIGVVNIEEELICIPKFLKKKPKLFEFENELFYFLKITKKTIFSEPSLVYNIEVEDEHNYCVENVAVFNCESWSNASAMLSGNTAWYTDPSIKNKKTVPVLGENDFTIRTKEHIKTKDHTPFKKHWWKTVYSRLNGEMCAFNTIRIIEHYNPEVWIIENPQASKLWKYYKQIHSFEGFKNIAHYAAYEPEEFSKKPTCFYSNIELDLKKMKKGEKSKLTFQGKGKNAISRSYNIRSKIPLSLIKDILEQSFKEIK